MTLNASTTHWYCTIETRGLEAVKKSVLRILPVTSNVSQHRKRRL